MRFTDSLPFDWPGLSGSTAIDAGAWHLHGFAASLERDLLHEVRLIEAVSPFRNLQTPGGFLMSVAMTNCGRVGWVSDHTGYRYDPEDPTTGKPWPAMSALFLDLAERAAAAAGYRNFQPSACLVNRYLPGAHLSLHQDRDELDFKQPIVSVSLGVPAFFLWGGAKRSDRPQSIALFSGDVVVWGGPTRLNFHGVKKLGLAQHPLTQEARINLTFRQAV
jgi:DNA oxidative demethylase